MEKGPTLRLHLLELFQMAADGGPLHEKLAMTGP